MSIKLGYNYFDSDAYFWENSEIPFTVKKYTEKRNNLIKNDLLLLKNFVLGGSVTDWGESVFPTFDLIVLLKIPNKIRIERLKKREIDFFGQTELLEPSRQKKFLDFLEWANDYDFCTGIAKRNIKSHNDWLSKQNCKILELSNNETNKKRLKIVLKFIKENF